MWCHDSRKKLFAVSMTIGVIALIAVADAFGNVVVLRSSRANCPTSGGSVFDACGKESRQRKKSKADFRRIAMAIDDDDNDMEAAHLSHQQQVFDEMSVWFADRNNEVTPELEPVYEEMATDLLHQLLMSKSISASEQQNEEGRCCHILDVACGTGVLWEFLIKAAEDEGVQLNITGVDLSPKMVGFAKKRIENLPLSPDETTPHHSIQVFCSDVIEFCKSEHLASVDGCILNACFGNFWDRRAVLEVLPGKTICISHPLGASYVKELHDRDPKTVPHTLPETSLELLELTQGSAWVLQASTSVGEDSSEAIRKSQARPYYLTALSRG